MNYTNTIFLIFPNNLQSTTNNRNKVVILKEPHLYSDSFFFNYEDENEK